MANLSDIISHREGKPQLYGTRFDITVGRIVLTNLKDPKHLEARRKKLGLMPTNEHVKLLEELYKLPVDTTTIPH